MGTLEGWQGEAGGLDPADMRHRAEVELPAVAPTGQYFAEVWLFQDGEPVSVSNLTLTVEKVGIERDIFEFAHRRPWTYGVLCVILAMFTGWAASRIFRRQ